MIQKYKYVFGFWLFVHIALKRMCCLSWGILRYLSLDQFYKKHIPLTYSSEFVSTGGVADLEKAFDFAREVSFRVSQYFDDS